MTKRDHLSRTPSSPGEPIPFTSGSREQPGQASGHGASSLTYEPFYGLTDKPFSLAAHPRFFFRSAVHEPVFTELVAGLQRREGLVVLTGGIGTGKTTLVRSVLQHLGRRTFAAFIPDPRVSREDLLKMLLVDFGVVPIADLKRGALIGMSRSELSYLLGDFLETLAAIPALAVLVIDDAQRLPEHLLEEIRILSEVERREKLLQIVLVGQPELTAHLTLPPMRQLDQRVSVRCELPALGASDVAAYIRHRLDVAGGGRVSFSRTACDAVFQEAGGVPRLINAICDRALQLGHRAGVDRIDQPIVSEAVRRLGLARTPTDSEPDSVPRPPAESAPPPHADPTRGADPGVDSAPFLSEFTAEQDIQAPQPPPVAVADLREMFKAGRPVREGAAVPARRIGVRPLVTFLVLTALAAVAAAALWNVYADARVTGVDALAPPRAARPVPVMPAVSLPPTAGTDASGADDTAPGPPFIQVASFQARVRAERLLSELAAAGVEGRIVARDLGPGGLLHEVVVGGFATIEQADADLARIHRLPGYADAHVVSN